MLTPVAVFVLIEPLKSLVPVPAVCVSEAAVILPLAVSPAEFVNVTAPSRVVPPKALSKAMVPPVPALSDKAEPPLIVEAK